MSILHLVQASDHRGGQILRPHLLHHIVPTYKNKTFYTVCVESIESLEATKWENRGSETFCAPPQDSVKLFAPPPPPFKECKRFAPLLQYGSNLKLQHKNYPKSFCAPPPISMAQHFSAPPFRRGKTSRAPPPPVL